MSTDAESSADLAVEVSGHCLVAPRLLEVFSSSLRLWVPHFVFHYLEDGEGRREEGGGRREGEGRREEGEGRREKGGRREEGGQAAEEKE